jgi:SAM-dependent methyltransferase
LAMPAAPSTLRVIPRPIHPFPARMAAHIPWRELSSRKGRPLRVLDPMAGSGTTLVVARTLGHVAIGFDTDPLAVLIASAWCADVSGERLVRLATRVQARATLEAHRLPLRDAYPPGADEETRAFVRYWFDPTNRRQLLALARTISKVRERSTKLLLWCAFSRLIITKQASASLALDLAHSRPHRPTDYKKPIRPLEHFLRAVRTIVDAAPFKTATERRPLASVRTADARRLPVDSSTIDIVITSPPYLNAIDYLRGHKFSLIWMGHALLPLRQLRAQNIGTEVSAKAGLQSPVIAEGLRRMGRLGSLRDRERGMLARYVSDMDKALSEIARVLVPCGRAVLVVGDCSMRGVFVRNSRALAFLCEQHGLTVATVRRRTIPPNRRYLPPPSSRSSGRMLGNRLRHEVLLTVTKGPQ